jgi:hypothetical protein
MMINCKESAIRSSQLRERRVKGIRKLELWYHLLICRFCRTYHGQIQMLGKLSRLIGKASAGSTGVFEDASDERLSAEAKTRIKKNLTAV